MTGPTGAGDPSGGGSATVDGYAHELGIYTSDREFLDLISPFALGAIDAGDPVVFAYGPDKVELLRASLPESEQITKVKGKCS